MREVGDEILDDVHMRQRRDPHIAFAVFNRGRAGKAVFTIDIHRAGTANPLPPCPAEIKGGIMPALPMAKGCEQQRPTISGSNQHVLLSLFFARSGSLTED